MPTTVLNGHVIDVLQTLPANWFHAVVTSPPYWLLRKYGIPPVPWKAMSYSPIAGMPKIKVPAWEGELGREASIHHFIGHMLLVFREVKRVLRDDGVVFVNLGDKYLTNAKGGTGKMSTLKGGQANQAACDSSRDQACNDSHIPNKNRAGVPWRFALAMQADGWYWRDEIIWAKTSPMPSSQTDRCTTSHEVILMFSKSKRYFYDIYAIMEKCSGTAHSRGKGTTPKSAEAEAGTMNNDSHAKATAGFVEKRYPRDVWTISTEPSTEKHYALYPTKLASRMIKAGTSEHGCCSLCGKPYQRDIVKRRVPTRPGTNTKLKDVAGWDRGPGAHDVIEHNTELKRSNMGRLHATHGRRNGKAIVLDPSDIVGNRDPYRHTTVTETTGWRKMCSCTDGTVVPCRVLDQFGGMGTTALSAERLHRDATIIDLNPYYAERAHARLERLRKLEAGMFS